MIENEKYIFIHIPKTAGTYVRNILTKYFNGNYNTSLYRFHAIPKNFNTKKKLIGLIRNPMELYVSLYFWIKQGNNLSLLPESYRNELFELTNKCDDDKINFKNFILFIYSINEGFTENGHWWGKKIDYKNSKIYDIGAYTLIYCMMYLNNNFDDLINNKKIMDYLINTDDIDNNIINIFSELNFNIDIFKNEHNNLEKKNCQKHEHYEYYYDNDNELIELVKYKERYIYNIVKLYDFNF